MNFSQNNFNNNNNNNDNINDNKIDSATYVYSAWSLDSLPVLMPKGYIDLKYLHLKYCKNALFDVYNL